MRVGIISAYVDPERNGADYRGPIQPQIGPLIAGLLPADADIDVVLDTSGEPDWTRDYALVFISALHSDFDRARQISHYWRRRGAKTVFGGPLASAYATLCQPFFDAVAVGDAESTVPTIYRDFCRGALQPLYISSPYNPEAVPVPRFDLAATQQMLPLSLEATRGCPFSCDFCSLTGAGTRYHTRPVELVVRDLREGRRMLSGLVPDYKLPGVGFVDNNIGGSLSYLARLCEAIRPLRIRWGAAITFNCVQVPDVVKALAGAGCRFLFMGLESFNPAVIADMRKHQNVIDATRSVIDRCRRHGILVLSGLMLSPSLDDGRTIAMIPRQLRTCGLHVPTFIAFECPFPGTPFFGRLAAQPEPAFLPGALLRDFNGYTLVVRPSREPLDRFMDHYRSVLHAVFTRAAKLRKLIDDLPRLLSSGVWESAMVDVMHQWVADMTPDPARTYLAGSDRCPPEASRVPLTQDDFDSEEHYHAVMDPWRVTDDTGRVLPAWMRSTRVFDRKGRISADALQLIAVS
jgi:radical SAM superfamily enzyme YgiQ (UPF0313 family)